MMKKENISKVFQIFRAQNPEPKTELEYTNNFTLLIAVVLSAQATDIGVNKATKSLFAKYDTPELIYSLGVEGLSEYINSIGLYNSKAKNIIKLCYDLIHKHNSEVPEDFKKLNALAGVGVKTANVVLNCAFGHPTIAVDTHVFRVSNRLGIVKTTTPEKTADPLLKKIPKEFQLHAHHWLILHGRYICKARKPECIKCNVIEYCNFRNKSI